MKGENMMNKAHKGTNPSYRDNYEEIFGKQCPHCGKKCLDMDKHFCPVYFGPDADK